VPAGGGAAAPVTPRVNDEFAVKKSTILCAVHISKTLVPGKKLVACFVFADPMFGPVPKTYAVALTVNGEAVLHGQ
jgi:hypothetical protein